MLTELCAYLKNWFETEMLYGDFVISNGVVTYADGTALPLQEGQYYRIIGSIFNDGVYASSTNTHEASTSLDNASWELKNEAFNGSIWALAIPKEVIALAGEIEAWKAKYEGADSAALSPYNSESFGGYSYSKSGGGSSSSGSGAGGWQGAFANKLARYRKV